MKRKTPHIRTKRVVDPLPFGPGFNAHRLVMEIAVEMANELFEVYARENRVYRALRAEGQLTEAQARHAFVMKMAPQVLEDARETMAMLLGQPDDVVSPGVKETIYEALCLDNDMRGKRPVAASRARVPASVH